MCAFLGGALAVGVAIGGSLELGAMSAEATGLISAGSGALSGLTFLGATVVTGVPTYLLVRYSIYHLCRMCNLSERTAKTLASVFAFAAAFFVAAAVTWAILGTFSVSLPFTALLAITAIQAGMWLCWSTVIYAIASAIMTRQCGVHNCLPYHLANSDSFL